MIENTETLRREDDAKFLDQVADMISRQDGDPRNSEGIWALKLRAIAAALRAAQPQSQQDQGGE